MQRSAASPARRHDGEAPDTGVRRRADGPEAASLARMQSLAGNAAVTRLVERAPGTLPVPGGLVHRNVGWAKGSKAGRAWNLGEKAVGGVRRIPLEGLAEGFGEHAMIKSLSSESAKGRAIVLVPAALNPKLGI